MVLLIFFLLYLSFSESRLLSPIMIVSSSVSPWGSISFCLIYFDDNSLYHYIKCSLSLLTFLALKSPLSEIKVATPAFF